MHTKKIDQTRHISNAFLREILHENSIMQTEFSQPLSKIPKVKFEETKQIPVTSAESRPIFGITAK